MVRSGSVRRLALLVPLPFLLALATWTSARAAEHAGNALGGVIANVAAFLARSAPAPEEQELGARELAEPIPVTVARPRERRQLNGDPAFRHDRRAVLGYLLAHGPREADNRRAPASARVTELLAAQAKAAAS